MSIHINNGMRCCFSCDHNGGYQNGNRGQNRSQLPTTSVNQNINMYNVNSNHLQSQLNNNNNNNSNVTSTDPNVNSQEYNHYHHYYSYYYHKSPEYQYNRNSFQFPTNKMSLMNLKSRGGGGALGAAGGGGKDKGSPRKRTYLKGGAIARKMHEPVSAINPIFSDDDEDRENNHIMMTSNNAHYQDYPALNYEITKHNRDLFSENISSPRSRRGVHVRNQMVSPSDAQYQYLDDENDNKVNKTFNQIIFQPRRIPRSTSESNDGAKGKKSATDGIGSVGGGGGEGQLNGNNIKRRNSIDETVKTKDEPKLKSDEKILPSSRNTPNKGIKSTIDCNNYRRPSPQTHRVLLYNSNTSLRSPRNTGRHNHHHHQNHSHNHKVSPDSPMRAVTKQARSLLRHAGIFDDDNNYDYDISTSRDDENACKTSKSHLSRESAGHDISGKKNSILRDGKFVNLSVIGDLTHDASSIDDDFDLDRISYFGDSFDSTDSSDTEDGYRSHAYKFSHQDKLSISSTSTAHAISNISTQSSAESLANPESLLAPSLFPNVPPYLSFSSNLSKGPSIPIDLFKILKWKVTNVMPKLVRVILSNSGVRLLKNYPLDTNDWMGTWGKHMRSPMFKGLRPHQKLNHLPGSFRIGRKDACWKNLQKQMIRHGKKDFGFMPKTYVIPQDLNMLRKTWPKYAQRNFKWIVKPPASARGAGIRVVNRWAQIPKRRPIIVQKYIERPLLINGSKFDLRLYVLVTSISPLRVFMYHNGLARFASVKYSDRPDTLNDRCMHLTNYSINKFSSNYSKNEDVNACHGHKWTIKSLWSYLQARGIRTDRLWEALRNLVLRTILAGENSIYNMMRLNVESKYSCYELFGFDVLLDSDLIPWLLEVNISPSLHSDLPLDAHVKAPLVQGVLNTAMYQVPPKLSHEKQKEIIEKMKLKSGPLCFDRRIYISYLSRVEKLKHNQFTRKSLEDREEYIETILNDLTPDDVRCLIIAEDEFARCAPLERIFPTCNTHKYLKYTDYPRYYNRLLDAWETRYSKNRDEGINLLKSYCEKKYHLQVPPTPVKKDSNNNTEGTNSVDVAPDNNNQIEKMAEKSMVPTSQKSKTPNISTSPSAATTNTAASQPLPSSSTTTNLGS